jgi:hypothetical protein
MGRCYDTAAWRSLPRTRCIVERLLGDAAGDCAGPVHRHHVDPSDPMSRTVEVCQRHHGRLHGVLGRVNRRRVCHHRHSSRAAREACERRLNR